MITIDRRTRLRLASQPSGIDEHEADHDRDDRQPDVVERQLADQVEVGQGPAHVAESSSRALGRPVQDADRSAVAVDDEGQAAVAARAAAGSRSRLPRSAPMKLATKSSAGVGEDLGRGAGLGDHAALAEDDHLVGEHERLVDVVGDEHDGLAELALQPVELDLEVGPHDRVDRAERLVHQQDVGVAGQRAGDADALLLATRELARVALGQRAVETDLVEQLERRRSRLRPSARR